MIRKAMNDIQTKLDYSDAIADSFLELGESYSLQGDLEEALKCAHVAAAVLSKQNRQLSSARLEAILRFVAESLSKYDNRAPVDKWPTRNEQTYLHVLSEALPAGGLTAMATRWINNDRSGRIHSIALLAQETPIPEDVVQTARSSGGRVFKVSPADSFLNRAIWLKELANEVAACVILHVDMSDVICGVAFGTKSGPRVMLVNHAAHLFWTGVSYADLVINCRGSLLEENWTMLHRSAKKCATVPIPLSEPVSPATSVVPIVETKAKARRDLGIPSGAVVLLTIGAYFKYLPTDRLDFVAIVEEIISKLPYAYLIAVGFEADPRWRKASARLNNRIRVLGVIPKADITRVHDAADLYIEGFPFGTTTALLEAGLQGIPVVLAPDQCPPPYGSDGLAIDGIIKRARTLEEYKASVYRLANDSEERNLQGNRIRESIRRHHTGRGWLTYLDNAIGALPQAHSINAIGKSPRTPASIHEYWSILVDRYEVSYDEIFEQAFRNALELNLQIGSTKKVTDVLSEYRSLGINQSIPVPILTVLLNLTPRYLPVRLSSYILRLFSFLYRPGLLPRAGNRFFRYVRRTKAKGSWYSDYRSGVQR
jgi:hypothetical protein